MTQASDSGKVISRDRTAYIIAFGAIVIGALATLIINPDMMSTIVRSFSTQKALTRPLLADLHDWWLQGVPQQHDQPVSPDTYKRWFSTDPAIDKLCSDKYGPAMIEAGGMSTDELDKLVTTPEDAVSVVLLLDQIPRNIFRGDEAAKVYNDYDPKAAALARTYLGDKRVGQRDEFSNFGRAMWLYMPLMHSEKLSDHEFFASLLERRLAACMSDTEREGVKRIAAFEGKHREVLEKFGRYPSRNEALGRQSTPEEIEHLKNGPGW